MSCRPLVSSQPSPFPPSLYGSRPNCLPLPRPLSKRPVARPPTSESSTSDALFVSTFKVDPSKTLSYFVLVRSEDYSGVTVPTVPTAPLSTEAIADYKAFQAALRSRKPTKCYDGIDGTYIRRDVRLSHWRHIPYQHICYQQPLMISAGTWASKSFLSRNGTAAASRRRPVSARPASTRPTCTSRAPTAPRPSPCTSRTATSTR